MLELKVPSYEVFDESTNEFVTVDEVTLQFEHSLVSLSKWEAKYKKPFLSGHKDHAKTNEELQDYLRMMVLNDIDFDIFDKLRAEDVRKIEQYIADPQTATTIRSKPVPTNSIQKELVTSELVYYWMVSLQIPFETQYWHLNRLIMLIQVINHKNTPPKKLGGGSLASQRRALNAQRKSAYGTNG